MTFPVTPPIGLPYRVFQLSTSDASDASSYSFASAAIGVAASDRLVAVLASIQDASSSTSALISSPTIGGNTATIAAQINNLGKATALFYLPVPTGATATIAFGCNSVTCERAAIGVYSLYGLVSPTPVDTDTIAADPGAFTALSVQPNSVTIGAAIAGSTAGFSISGFTQDASFVVETASFACGSANPTATLSTFGGVFDGSTTAFAVAATWR